MYQCSYCNMSRIKMTLHILIHVRYMRVGRSHSLTFCQYILTASVILHANKHTSKDHDPALPGKFYTLVSHICDIVIDRLYADHGATVSCICTLPLIKIYPVYGYIDIDNEIIPLTYEQRMNFHSGKMTVCSSLNTTGVQLDNRFFILLTGA